MALSTRTRNWCHLRRRATARPRLPHEWSSRGIRDTQGLSVVSGTRSSNTPCTAAPAPRHALALRVSAPWGTAPRSSGEAIRTTSALHNDYEDADEIVTRRVSSGRPKNGPTNGMRETRAAGVPVPGWTGCKPTVAPLAFQLATGGVSEEQLTDSITEFGHGSTRVTREASTAMLRSAGKPAWFLFEGW